MKNKFNNYLFYNKENNLNIKYYFILYLYIRMFEFNGKTYIRQLQLKMQLSQNNETQELKPKKNKC